MGSTGSHDKNALIRFSKLLVAVLDGVVIGGGTTILTHFHFGVRRGERFMDLVGQWQKCGLLIFGASALREEASQTRFTLVRCYPFRFVGHTPQRLIVRTERNSIPHA